MDELKAPVFSTKSILEKKQVGTNSVKQECEAESSEHEFFVSESYKDFEKRLLSLEQNKTYHFVSFGQWSLKHVVFHLLKLTGKAQVYSTTYGLGPSSARGLVNGLKSGMISDCFFLYDWKIKQYKEEAHNLCSSNFKVKITSIHAKVTVIYNDLWGIVVTGSANWSDKNNKIESLIVTTDRNLAEFHKKWIHEAVHCEATEPKNMIKEINIK
jgi:hypothetical protein